MFNSSHISTVLMLMTPMRMPFCTMFSQTYLMKALLLYAFLFLQKTHKTDMFDSIFDLS